MKKNIKIYKQKGNTCAIACMLMVLEYYKIISKSNWLYEKKYYNFYKSKYVDGTPFSALAWHLSKNGLDTEIIHSEKDLFTNKLHMFSDNEFNNLMNEYKQFLEYAKEKNTKISNGCIIDSNLLKKKLDENKLIILAGQINNYLHAILICGYEKDEFIICDPLYKQIQIKSNKEINSFMNTKIGIWCIVAGENNNIKGVINDKSNSI